MEVIKLYDNVVQEFVTLHGREALQKLLDVMQIDYNNDNDVDSVLSLKPF